MTEIDVERLLQLVRLVGRDRLLSVSPPPGQVEQRLRVQRGQRVRAEQSAHRVAGDRLAGEHHQVRDSTSSPDSFTIREYRGEHLERGADSGDEVVGTDEAHLLEGIQPLGDAMLLARGPRRRRNPPPSLAGSADQHDRGAEHRADLQRCYSLRISERIGHEVVTTKSGGAQRPKQSFPRLNIRVGEYDRDHAIGLTTRAISQSARWSRCSNSSWEMYSADFLSARLSMISCFFGRQRRGE